MKTKLQIKDLNVELMNLYYQDGCMDFEEMELFNADVKFNPETGEEIGANEVLNKEVVASYISVRTEFFAAELGDQLCNAALFILEEETYESDFGDLESRDVKFTFSDFITDEQKETNFKFYMEQLRKCYNFKRLKVLRESVLSGQKGKNGMYFFKKGQSKQFWDAYNIKKAELNSITKSTYKGKVA